MKNRASPPPPDRSGPPDFAPVPRKCARHDGWTPQRQRAFIDALSDTGSVKAACAAVGMSSEGAYHLRRQPGAEEFAAAWDAALEHCIGILRDTLMDRAIHGVETPILSHGKQYGTRRTFNDRLGAFMLRNYDGRMSGGASGVPLRMRRIVDEAVAKARAEWEAERAAEAEGIGERVRAHLKVVRRRLIAEGMVEPEAEDLVPLTPEEEALAAQPWNGR